MRYHTNVSMCSDDEVVRGPHFEIPEIANPRIGQLFWCDTTRTLYRYTDAGFMKVGSNKTTERPSRLETISAPPDGWHYSFPDTGVIKPDRI